VESSHARERFAAVRRAHLATTGASGPHLVPICFALAGDVLYSAVDHKPKSGRVLRRLENIRRDPRVCVLADRYEDDWSRLWWVRADGRARILGDGAERESALMELAAKYPQYRADPPDGPVLAVDVERWSSWSGS
jgi:PPOX class probable F420-dependent enzyme